MALSAKQEARGEGVDEAEVEEELQIRQEQEHDVLRQANYAYRPNPLVAMYDSEAAHLMGSPALSPSRVQRTIGFE
jgi:hypothetical protein